MFASLKRKRHVVGGVARRRHRLERPAVAGRPPRRRRARGRARKSVSLEASSPRRLADMQRTRGAMRTFGQHQRAGRRLDRGHAGRMVAMGVGDEDVRHGLAAHRVEQCRDCGRHRRARILRQDGLLDGLRRVLAVELVLDRRRGVERRAVRLGDLGDQVLVGLLTSISSLGLPAFWPAPAAPRTAS